MDHWWAVTLPQHLHSPGKVFWSISVEGPAGLTFYFYLSLRLGRQEEPVRGTQYSNLFWEGFFRSWQLDWITRISVFLTPHMPIRVIFLHLCLNVPSSVFTCVSIGNCIPLYAPVLKWVHFCQLPVMPGSWELLLVVLLKRSLKVPQAQKKQFSTPQSEKI